MGCSTSTVPGTGVYERWGIQRLVGPWNILVQVSSNVPVYFNLARER